MDNAVNDVGPAAGKSDHGHQGRGHEQDGVHGIEAQYNFVSGHNADDEDDRYRHANGGKGRTQADIDGALESVGERRLNRSQAFRRQYKDCDDDAANRDRGME